MSARFRIRAIVVIAALTLVLLASWLFVLARIPVSPASLTAQAGTETGAEVHGFVTAETSLPNASGISTPRAIHVPNIRVFLRNVDSGETTAAVLTNIHGQYILNSPRAGRYQICAEASGFVSRCEPGLLSLAGRGTSAVRQMHLQPISAIVGHVALENGTPCFHENSFFRSSQSTTISLEDGRGTLIAAPVLANSAGWFVLPRPAGQGSYNVRAVCGAIEVKQALALTDNSRFTSLELTLPNTAPEIVSLEPTLGGKGIRRAFPGAVLQVTATVANHSSNQLHYRWGDGTGRTFSVDAPTIRWQLAKVPTTNFLFLEVSDSKGGFANSQLAIETGSTDATFAGKISASNRGRLRDVLVNVNGHVVTATRGGDFFASVPQSDRYVVNVKHPGYALVSQVFYASTGGLALRLEQSHRTTCNPGRTCVARAGAEEPSSGVRIDANTLVDSEGNPATSAVNVYVHNFDMTQPNPIPGDFAALDRAGNPTTLQSYGAVEVDIRDSAGVRYNLARGAEAEISIQVPDSAAGSAPASVPLFVYDERTGYWKETGQANLVAGRYQAKVHHFSVFDAAITLTHSACIRMTVGDKPTAKPPRFAPLLPFNMVAKIPTSTGTIVKSFPVTETLNGLFRLPPKTQVTIELHPNSAPDSILGTLKVNSGAAIPDSFNGFPPIPYTACNAMVTLAAPLPVNPIPYLTFFQGAGTDAEAINYYNTIAGVSISRPNATTAPSCTNTNLPCTGAKCILSGWQTANGFDGTEPAVAYYYNAGDLGLGREMHCRPNGADVACYVTNYGSPGGNPDAAINSAIKHENPVATVAMEFSATGGSTGVKFYIYNHAAGDHLCTNAVLDSQGPKFTPQLCIQCHGGSYSTTTHTASGASFLPFDVFSFDFSPPMVSLADEQDQFRQLNALVKSTNPNTSDPNDPIRNLIDGLYPCGVNTPGCQALNTYVPPPPMPGWTGHTALYQTIPRVYCRTCHVAQFSSIDWTQFSDFGSTFASDIQSRVCTSGSHVMPEAEVPFKKFWFSTSPYGPAYLADPSLGLNFAGGCPR